MVKPLTFKGEKRKKRKRDLSPKGLDGATSPRPGRDGDGDGGEDQAGEPLWITATSAQGVSGPITLVLAGSRPVSCIACDAAGTVFVSSMENVIESAPSSAEPHDVRQVWVTSRVAGTTGLALKSWTGKSVLPSLPNSVPFRF